VSAPQGVSPVKPIRVGLLGLGTVGSGTLEVLRRNREEIARRAGREIVVTQACARDLSKPRRAPLEGVRFMGDAKALVASPDIDIVVEVMGGESPARDLVLEAISHGKHVVTANKALLAKHGNAIFAAAHEKGVMVAFEAAVAGGVPIIKAIRDTANNSGMTLTVAFDYGSRAEIAHAAETLRRSGTMIDAESLGSAMYMPDLPPVDVLVRTSGETRVSNFLLWQSAGAPISFSASAWPDFSEDDLKEAIALARTIPH